MRQAEREKRKATNGWRLFAGPLTARLLLAFVAAVMPAAISAQGEPEYRLEIGGAVGTMTYMGDLNGSPLASMKPMGAVVAKYKLNPRMAWTLDLGYGQLNGSSDKVKGWLPDKAEHPMSFKTSVVDVQLRYEYNFWAFGTGREYHGAKRITPFITLGLGAVVGSAKATYAGLDPRKENTVAVQMPIGLGVKYKLATRLNLTAEWVVHFVATDKLDTLTDPYEIRSHGLFKNTDGLATLQLSLTYDLWERCRTCHNDL